VTRTASRGKAQNSIVIIAQKFVSKIQREAEERTQTSRGILRDKNERVQQRGEAAIVVERNVNGGKGEGEPSLSGRVNAAREEIIARCCGIMEISERSNRKHDNHTTNERRERGGRHFTGLLV
jgi:hypothetical protein